MGSNLLEEASVTSKNLVSMNSQPSLGGEPLDLPNTNSILGVDDGKTFNSPLFGENACSQGLRNGVVAELEILANFISSEWKWYDSIAFVFFVSGVDNGSVKKKFFH